MTEEEKKAIEYYKNKLREFEQRLGTKVTTEDNINTEILLNLIQKQEKEINKLNSVIDRMAELIEECRQNDCIETTDDLDMSEIAGADKIKEYFMKEK